MKTKLQQAAADLQGALVDQYNAWGKLQGRELGGADEELVESYWNAEQRAWLERFVEAWDAWDVLDRYADNLAATAPRG